MLQLLHEPQGAGRFAERASTVEHDLSSAERATEIAPAPLVLFDIQDAAMPPPSPASPQALALLSKMLVFNPAKRCSMQEALEGEYLAPLHQGRA